MKRAPSLILALLLALLPCASAEAGARGRQGERPALRVTGEVLSASAEEYEKLYVRLKLKVRLRFYNAGARPLILLDREPWVGSESLSLTREDAYAGRFVHVGSHWPSLYRAPGNEWERLTRDLDQKQPPPALTRIIPPGGSWEWVDDYRWTMSKEMNNNGNTRGNWNELRGKSPLWLTLSFEMWPANVEPNVRGGGGRDEFGNKLRRRWKEFGDLWLAHISSEPLELRVDEAAREASAGN